MKKLFLLIVIFVLSLSFVESYADMYVPCPPDICSDIEWNDEIKTIDFSYGTIPNQCVITMYYKEREGYCPELEEDFYEYNILFFRMRPSQTCSSLTITSEFCIARGQELLVKRSKNRFNPPTMPYHLYISRKSCWYNYENQYPSDTLLVRPCPTDNNICCRIKLTIMDYKNTDYDIVTQIQYIPQNPENIVCEQIEPNQTDCYNRCSTLFAGIDLIYEPSHQGWKFYPDSKVSKVQQENFKNNASLFKISIKNKIISINYNKETNNKGKIELTLFDILGRNIFSEKNLYDLHSTYIIKDINLKTGIYFLRIKIGNRYYSKLFIYY